MLARSISSPSENLYYLAWSFTTSLNHKVTIWWGFFRLSAPTHAGTAACAVSLKKPHHIITLRFSEVVNDHAKYRSFVYSILNFGLASNNPLHRQNWPKIGRCIVYLYPWYALVPTVGTEKNILTPFWNKRFMLNEMTRQNASKFIYMKTQSCFFHFSFRVTLFFP